MSERSTVSEISADAAARRLLSRWRGAKSSLTGHRRRTDSDGRRAARSTKKDAQDKLDKALKILEKSDTGAALLKLAEAHKIRFVADTHTNVYGYYMADDDPKTVGVGTRQAISHMVATLAHELRHAWQDVRGQWSIYDLSPRDALLLERFLEADAEAVCIQVCQELCATNAAPFEQHLNSSYGDLSNAFLQAIEIDPISAENGEALRAAFDSWFAAQGRRFSYDEEIVGLVEDSMYEYGQMAAHGFKTLNAVGLTKLGELPLGGNYLKDTGRIALGDDFYRGGIAANLVDRLAHVERYIHAVNGKSEGAAPPVKRRSLPLPRSAPRGPMG